MNDPRPTVGRPRPGWTGHGRTTGIVTLLLLSSGTAPGASPNTMRPRTERVLIELTYWNRIGGKRGLRVLVDGRVEDYRTTTRQPGPDGIGVTRAVPPGWYPLKKIPLAAVAQLRQAIARTRPERLPKQIQGPPPNRSDTSAAEWVLRTAAGVRRIRVHPWGPSYPEVAPLLQLHRFLLHFALGAPLEPGANTP